MIVGAPLAVAVVTMLAFVMYASFHKLCHQLPERRFHRRTSVRGLCSLHWTLRGFLRGFATVGSAVAHYPGASATLAFIAVIPMALDFRLSLVFGKTYSSRFVTGLILSVTAVFYVMLALLGRVWSCREYTDKEK
jgi:uncharacterized membrane protein